MSAKKTTFTWVVEFEIDERWVADGFEMTDDRAQSIIEKTLPYAYSHEVSAKVLRKPSQKRIRKVQGYDDSDLTE